MKYDETQLIEFFGALPSDQCQGEKDFFGTTVFNYQQGRYQLPISFSAHRNDFYLDLKDAELAVSILELRLGRVEEIRVRRDKPGSEPVLIAVAGGEGGDGKKEVLMQTIGIMLEPNICVRMSNQLE